MTDSADIILLNFTVAVVLSKPGLTCLGKLPSPKEAICCVRESHTPYPIGQLQASALVRRTGQGRTLGAPLERSCRSVDMTEMADQHAGGGDKEDQEGGAGSRDGHWLVSLGSLG